MSAQNRVGPRVRQSHFNPFWNQTTHFAYGNFRLKKYVPVFSSFLRCAFPALF